MRLIGVTSLDQLGPHLVNTAVLERDLPPEIREISFFPNSKL